jgi:glycine cleavage system H protein
MSETTGEFLRYRRNHFSARLPAHLRYTLSHFWLEEREAGCWRVGLTPFATRMLGEIVEFDLEVAEGREVAIGEVLGWIEGFKAVSDLYSAAAGEFRGANAQARADTERVCADPYCEGWLYMVKGIPDPQAVDVQGYSGHLDRTIDKMLEQPWRSKPRGDDRGSDGSKH